MKIILLILPPPPNDGDLTSDITIDKVDRAARNAKMVKLLDLDNVPNKVEKNEIVKEAVKKYLSMFHVLIRVKFRRHGCELLFI